MYPNIVFQSGIFCYHLSEFVVDCLVRIPIGWIEVTACLQIMKEGPYDFVGKSEVILVDLFVGQ